MSVYPSPAVRRALDPHHQPLAEQAEEAVEATVRRVERITCDLAEARMRVTDLERELRNAEKVLHDTEARANELRLAA